MTAPRQILPGQTHLITRRCSERRMFLRPSALTNEVFLFVLAVAAKRFQIQVHALCVMSNHFHLLVTDVAAELPAFMQYLDGLVARATNSMIGHWEGFWSSEGSYSDVIPAEPDDIVAKIAYVLANPVAAGLVQHGRDWPGLWTAPAQLGATTLTVSRPKKFFRARGSMPDSVDLVLTVPPGFASAEEFRERVAAATAALEAEHRRTAQAEGRSFLGVAKVLAQKPFARPAPGEPRRRLDPRVAARDKWKRIEAVTRNKEFAAEHRRARIKFKDGFRDALFPAGTYLMRVLHAVRCAAYA